jgi:hypothetical protein
METPSVLPLIFFLVGKKKWHHAVLNKLVNLKVRNRRLALSLTNR